MVPKDPDSNDFIDNESLGALRDKVIDTLRPLGLTIEAENVMFSVHPEHGMMMMIPALVRPSAKERLVEDRKSREEFNRMMANEAEAKIEDVKRNIADAIASGNLEGILFGGGTLDSAKDQCLHENLHPSGFCMDCGWGMEGDE